MTATVAQLGARAIRKLGIAIVADANRPGAPAPKTSADIADDMLRQMGIVTAEAARPAAVGTVTQAEIAARALRAVGVNPVAGIAQPAGLVAAGDIAARALRAVGIDPAATGGFIGTGVTLTLAQIAIAALVKLAVITPDETGTVVADHPEDYADALARAGAVHDMLVGVDYVTWAVAAIPDAAAEWYIVMVANLIAPGHGKPAALDAFNAARMMIRELAISGPFAQGLAADRVNALHDQLTAGGLTDWSVAAIPSSVSDAYVDLVAQALAPIYGKPVDAKVTDAAMASVRLQMLSGPRGQALALFRVATVHEELNALALVSWPLGGVPTAYADHYVTLTGIRLWPDYRTETADDRKSGLELHASVIAAMTRAAFVVGANSRAIDRVGVVHEELNALGLVTWTSNTIPVSASDCYMAMASSKMEAEGGKPLTNQQYAEWVQRVRMIAMGGPAGQALAEQKVRAEHYRLEARGLVRWTLFDIPLAAEESIVTLAAVLLGPECWIKVDPTWKENAERDLMRIVSLPSTREPVRADYF